MFSTWVQNHSPNKSWMNSRTFRDFLGLFPISSDEKEISSDLIWKMSLEIERMTCCFTKNDTLFLLKQAVDFYKQAQITRKRAKYLKNTPKISIFKLSENRIIPSNIFWIRIWALNGGIETVKISITQNRKLYFQLRVAHLSLPKARINPRIFLLRSALH